MGFEEIQYDYVRFPDEPRSRMALAVFPARRGTESSRDGVTVTSSCSGPDPASTCRHHRHLRPHHDGETTWASAQYWEDLVIVADVVLPMATQSLWPGSLRGGPPQRLALPHGVETGAGGGIRRNKALAPKRTAEIRPYLQAFTLGPPKYTPSHVREQIRAATELGLNSWVLWNPRSVYDRGYFKADSLPGPLRAGGAPER